VPSRRGGMIGLDFLEMPIAQSGMISCMCVSTF
jgi:hypothetical protein